jgi:hypothetical protein
MTDTPDYDFEATDLWREAYLTAYEHRYRSFELQAVVVAFSDLGHLLSEAGLLLCPTEGGWLFDAWILRRPLSLKGRLAFYGRGR